MFAAVAGSWSPQTTSMSRSTLTTRPACSANVASTALRRTPFTACGLPATITSTGPSSLTRTLVPTVEITESG
ncbi:hypothetical protein JNW90_04975 [Micromonospora sp. STR1s_5]|nr:hypothetical protein [Micromonospora sp. STR1s_5]